MNSKATLVRRPQRLRALAAVLAIVLLGVGIYGRDAPSVQAAPHTFNPGDVFAGVGAGMIKRFAPDGTLLQTLDTTSGSTEETGMCFEALGNLYTTNWEASNMTKFDVNGTVLVHPWAGPFSVHPESCVVDRNGNIYTGEVDGDNMIRKWNSGGTLLASYSPVVEDRGIDWIDLAADQCTMFYTSEGSTVKRFDVCANTQLPDFATGLTSPCYALRIRPNGEVMVACSSQAYRLNSTGTTIQTYVPGEGEALFALNLDPDGTSFWTGGYFSGNVFRVDIASGNTLTAFNAGIVGVSMAGLAIFGELQAATAVTLASFEADSQEADGLSGITLIWLAAMLVLLSGLSWWASRWHRREQPPVS